MRKIMLTFCLLLWPILSFGQVQLDRIESHKSLVDLPGVQILYTDQKENFEDIKDKDFSHAYTESDFPKEGKVLWLKIKLVVKEDRKSTRLNSSHVAISYAVFCLKKKKKDDLMTDNKT